MFEGNLHTRIEDLYLAAESQLAVWIEGYPLWSKVRHLTKSAAYQRQGNVTDSMHDAIARTMEWLNEA